MVLSLVLAPVVALAVTHAPRTPAITGKVLVTTSLQAGALDARLSVADVRNGSRSVVNGVLDDGDADLFLRFELRAHAGQVHGLRVQGEPVPYQSVRARIENLSTHDTIEIALLPWLSVGNGWFYASNVKLPPVDRALNPFRDAYRVTIQSSSEPALVLLEDALPPSSLWRSNGSTTLLVADLRFGPITELPLTDVADLASAVEAFPAIRIALRALDFAEAATLYEAHVSGLFTDLEDPSQYDPARGLGGPLLQELDENVIDALLGQPVHGECNGPLEDCAAWVDEALQRGFMLGVMQHLDRAVTTEDVAAWDRAYTLYLPLRVLMLAEEAECENGAPQALELDDCAMVRGVDEAFLAGANALIEHRNTEAAGLRSFIVHRLEKTAYAALARHVLRAVIDVDPASRVAAHASFFRIWHLFSFSDRVQIERVVANVNGISRADARALFLQINDVLGQHGFAPTELVDADDFLEVHP